MKFAYADPPYIGQAKKHYGRESSYGGEVDQKALIERLCREYPDGWALSSSSSALKKILSYCPDDVRVMAWVKPFASFKPGVNPAYAWEPVIIRGGRRRGRELPTVRDWVSANITLKKGLCGVKPPAFSKWVFEVLGMMSGDELADIFPGSGAVSTAWNEYRKQVELTEEFK
jgi:hypothetical protein